jgi:glucose-1-phosphate thymidylyltransferase
VEIRAGIQIAALEEIAFTNGWIDKKDLAKSAKIYGKAPYGQYLKKVVEGKILTDY